MCIRDRVETHAIDRGQLARAPAAFAMHARWLAQQNLDRHCLLYTSDAADERSSVDLGGRRIIKKKNSYTTEHDGSLSRQHTSRAATQT